MSSADHGLIAVDKMGTKVLFLDPDTFKTRKVIDGFQRTVHELLLVPETGLAYVPIYGDGIHGRNPNPGHTLCVFDLARQAHVGDIDLRPYIAPHTLKLGPDGLIYITCENSAVVAVIDRNIFSYFSTRIGRSTEEASFHDIFPPASMFRVGFRDAGTRDAFNQGLAGLCSSGEYSRLLEYYNIELRKSVCDH